MYIDELGVIGVLGRKSQQEEKQPAAETRYKAACGGVEPVALNVRSGLESVVRHARRLGVPLEITIYYLDGSLRGDSRRESRKQFGSVDELQAWDGQFKKITQAWATPVE